MRKYPKAIIGISVPSIQRIKYLKKIEKLKKENERLKQENEKLKKEKLKKEKLKKEKLKKEKLKKINYYKIHGKSFYSPSDTRDTPSNFTNTMPSREEI